ncbi:putative peptidase (DUF1758) domain-containing protein [Phthorimaea operculella]|nr:putative peptidase (DUF1758) domain-containing protein [Phthorimaea operculella]
MRLSKLDATYAEFCSIQSEIENLVSDGELEAEYVERSEFDTKYYRNIARAEALCLSCEKSKPKKGKASTGRSGDPTTSWDTLIIYIVASKLDERTLREWEEEKIKHKVVSLEMFTKFLKNRADLLDTIEQNFSKAPAVQAVNTNNKNYNVKTFAAATQPVPRVYQCSLCKDEHQLYKCEDFAQMLLSEREQFVSDNKLCFLCLRSGHTKRMCRIGPCSICKGRHNSLLHKDSEPVQETATSLTSNSVCGQVLLATAMVNIRDSKNKLHEVRAVLDNGSQSSFMSESLLNKLALKPEEVCVSISGINNTASKSNKRCKSIIQSTLNDYQVEVEFLVLPHIASTGNPVVDVRSLDVPPHIKLADPKFYNTSSVDLLLGADIFWDLLGTNKLRASKNGSIKLMLYETELGYIVSGPTGSSRSTQKVSCNFNLCDSWRNQLSMFRVTEEIPVFKKQMLSLDEQVSEELLNEDVSHETDSRFSLAVPINSALGFSFNRANKSCFLSEELRLQRLAKLIAMYTEFLKDYADLGHMTKCDIEFRSVLDSRALSSSGLSLNDIQMVGPTTHSDSLFVFDILPYCSSLGIFGGTPTHGCGHPETQRCQRLQLWERCYQVAVFLRPVKRRNVIKEDAPTLKWKMGRIEKIYPERIISEELLVFTQRAEQSDEPLMSAT